MAGTPQRVSYRRELIEAMEAVFPPSFFRQFSRHGNSEWTARKVFWISVIMSWQAKATLGEQFEAARETLTEVFPRWKVPRSLGGFLDARQGLMNEMQGPILQQLRGCTEQWFEAFRVRSWLLFGVDGSRFETCRTTANEQALGCAGKESTTPQVFQTTLLHIGTGLPWDFRLGPGTESERRHLDDMLTGLPARSLLTADAGFISFHLCRWLVEHQQWFLLRVGSNVHFLTELGWGVEVKGKTVYLWPTKHRHHPPITLRLIVITAADRQPVYLATNVFDEELLSDGDAAEIYQLRWELELYYRSFKQTLGHKTLQSRTPHKSLTEQRWNVFGAWLLQLLTAQELIAADKVPASWSAAKARTAARKLLRQAVTQNTRPTSQSFRRQLRQATRDDSPRHGPKQIRNWPRKKQETPPGPPKLQPATEQQKQHAQRLRNTILTKL
jgi:hypothetical protein